MVNTELTYDQASQLARTGVSLFVQGARTQEVVRAFQTALRGFQRLLHDDVPGCPNRALFSSMALNSNSATRNARLVLVEVPNLHDDDVYIHKHAFLCPQDCNDNEAAAGCHSWNERDRVAFSSSITLFNIALVLTRDGKVSGHVASLRKALLIYDAAKTVVSNGNGTPCCTATNRSFTLLLLACLNNQAWILRRLGQMVEARQLHHRLVILACQARQEDDELEIRGNPSSSWSHEETDIILNFTSNYSIIGDVDDGACHVAPSA